MPNLRKKVRTLAPRKTRDIPVTQRMLYEVRDELISKIGSARSDTSSLRSEVASVRNDVKAVRSEVASVRNDVKAVRSEVASVRNDVKAVRSEVASVRNDVKAVRSEVASVRNDVKALEKKMDSRFEQMMGEMHRVALLVEEQNARNKFVLDGYASLHDRQDRLEEELSEIKKHA